MNKEDQLLKLSTTLYNQLNIIWARAIEGKGACYISSMERGDIEELLKEYNETKFPSLPAPPSSPTATAEEDFFKSIKWRIGKVITSKFLESNEGKFHTALEFNPAIHAAAEFCEHEKQEARRQAIDEIQTMIMQGNRAMTVVDFYDELEKLK